MITALYAGMPVSDLDASCDWYTNAAQAGAGRMTLGATADGNALALAESPAAG